MCPDCGTQTFSIGNAKVPPAGRASGWKKFFRTYPSIRATVDLYNTNPVPDWVSKRHEDQEAERRYKEYKKRRKVAMRRKAKRKQDPIVKLIGLASMKDRMLESEIHDPSRRSVWFEFEIDVGHGDQRIVYNGTTMAPIFWGINTERTREQTVINTERTREQMIGPRKRPNKRLKSKLDSEIREFAKAMDD